MNGKYMQSQVDTNRIRMSYDLCHVEKVVWEKLDVTIPVWETVHSVQGRRSSTSISQVQVQLADIRNMTR